jgi:hypothetical protein
MRKQLRKWVLGRTGFRWGTWLLGHTERMQLPKGGQCWMFKCSTEKQKQTKQNNKSWTAWPVSLWLWCTQPSRHGLCVQLQAERPEISERSVYCALRAGHGLAGPCGLAQSRASGAMVPGRKEHWMGPRPLGNRNGPVGQHLPAAEQDEQCRQEDVHRTVWRLCYL